MQLVKLTTFHKHEGYARAPALLGLAVVLFILVGLWLPEVRHYWISTPHYSIAIVQSAKSHPDNESLAKRGHMIFENDVNAVVASGAVVSEAENILAGEWHVPGFAPRKIHLPFDKRDLSAEWPTEQLFFASLRHIDILLSAYESTSQIRFLAAARDAINAWADYESSAILSSGFLWNDHAVARRILVLARYWSLIRNSTLIDDRSAELLLRFVGRSGLLLARSDQFTVRTNHGVMENLALLHIASAFPTLPESELFKKVAVERLHKQLTFYQSQEGVILEHSLGYHVFGIDLLKALNEYSDILDADFKEEIRERYAKACRFLAVVMRPDGSLPLIGNTKASDYSSACPAQSADTEAQIG